MSACMRRRRGHRGGPLTDGLIELRAHEGGSASAFAPGKRHKIVGAHDLLHPRYVRTCLEPPTTLLPPYMQPPPRCTGRHTHPAEGGGRGRGGLGRRCLLVPRRQTGLTVGHLHSSRTQQQLDVGGRRRRPPAAAPSAVCTIIPRAAVGRQRARPSAAHNTQKADAGLRGSRGDWHATHAAPQGHAEVLACSRERPCTTGAPQLSAQARHHCLADPTCACAPFPHCTPLSSRKPSGQVLAVSLAAPRPTRVGRPAWAPHAPCTPCAWNAHAHTHIRARCGEAACPVGASLAKLGKVGQSFKMPRLEARKGPGRGQARERQAACQLQHLVVCVQGRGSNLQTPDLRLVPDGMQPRARTQAAVPGRSSLCPSPGPHATPPSLLGAWVHFEL